MPVTKHILKMSAVTVLVGCLVGGALAKGGGGGFGGGGGGGRGGGGGGRGGGMHSSGHGSGMHSSGMSSAMARSYRGPSSGQSGSNHMAFRSGDMGSNRHGDGGRQASFRGADSFAQFGNRGPGDQGRGERAHNANYDRVVAFMNDRGNDRGSFSNNDRGNDHRNDGRNDRGSFGRDGDFGNRFDNGNNRFDRHGDNFHDNFRQNADFIRRDFRDRNDVPFRTGWWDNRRFDRGFGPWAFNSWWGRPWYWWGWSTAPYLDSWLSFGWDQPCYWDYGPGGYVTSNYPSNQLYQTYLPPVSAQPQMPVSPNYKQAFDLAHSAPAANQDDAAKSDWLPLGVFAVTKAGEKDENWMIQLGVNKQGVLSGTYYNQAKDSAHPLEGMVDKETHKAAWYFADGTENPMVFETSVDNLTEPQSSVMVHFGPGDTGVWQMVRLERPEAAQNQGHEAQQGQQGNEALPTPPQHELP